MSQTRAGIFIRRQGGEPRYYARLPGGRRVALCPRGATRATTDCSLARVLYGQLVAEEQRRQLRGALAMPEPMTFAEAALDYLMAKAEEGSVTAQWLEGDELRLKRALAHLGADRELSTIRVADMKGLAAALRRRGLSGGTIRRHLNTVGALYRWAGEAGHVDEGRNPVAAWRRKPSAQRREARWLEIPDAALLVEAARLYEPAHPKGGRPPVPFIYSLLATFLLTGGRESEVLGLEVSDVTLTGGRSRFDPTSGGD
jgi:integrase